VVVNLPGDAVAQDVRRAVAAAHPDAAPLLERALVVAGDRILDADAALPEETEIALVPPVSGG
jgi:molybdopterin converting factor small subunit